VEADLALRLSQRSPAAHDLTRGVDHRSLAHRDPSSQQVPPRNPPGEGL
jgi:hypothetical protein